MNARFVTVATVMALLLAACGGGSDPRPVVDDVVGDGNDASQPHEQVLTAYLTGSISKKPVPLAPDEYRAYGEAAFVFVGDLKDSTSFRGVVGFSLSSIPTDAKIESAALTTSFRRPIGTPYVDLGDLRVELVDLQGFFDESDYSADVLWAGTLMPGPGDQTLEVTEALRMILEDDTADFRIRFQRQTDGNNDTDITFMNDKTDVARSAGLDLSVPELKIVYREP